MQVFGVDFVGLVCQEQLGFTGDEVGVQRKISSIQHNRDSASATELTCKMDFQRSSTEVVFDSNTLSPSLSQKFEGRSTGDEVGVQRDTGAVTPFFKP